MAEESTGRVIVITVRRLGGFAGIAREWTAHPPGDDDSWPELVRRCPWDDVPDEPDPREPGAPDRFAWRLEAQWAPDGRRQRAALPESAATGPWRDLIDAVRGRQEERHPRASSA